MPLETLAEMAGKSWKTTLTLTNLTWTLLCLSNLKLLKLGRESSQTCEGRDKFLKTEDIIRKALKVATTRSTFWTTWRNKNKLFLAVLHLLQQLWNKRRLKKTTSRPMLWAACLDFSKVGNQLKMQLQSAQKDKHLKIYGKGWRQHYRKNLSRKGRKSNPCPQWRSKRKRKRQLSRTSTSSFLENTWKSKWFTNWWKRTGL